MQRELAAAAPESWRPPEGRFAIAACVVCFSRGLSGPGSTGDRCWAAAALMIGRRTAEQAALAAEAGAPYLPGLLALREGPALEAAVRALTLNPNVLLVDATGRDHPRRAGLAVHLGAVLGLATVGVTHRPLLAAGEQPDDRLGASTPLMLEGEQVGVWLRTRPGARPVAVHPGWRTEVDTAIEVVMRSCGGHRTPEVIRSARQRARLERARA